MKLMLLLTIFISFFCVYLILPYWIKKAKQVGLVWKDMNKPKQPKNVAGSTSALIEILALLVSILLISIIGLIDDIFGWQQGGLSKRSRLILVLLAAIPLMVINAGESTMMGINFGLIFPLLIIPIAILGATTTFNFLAGYNGLEAGQGIIILSALALVTWLTGNSWLSVIALCMVASLIAFYIFNKYPAKVFPGDIMTYSIGALIAVIAILGNIEKIAVLFFIPYIIETGLKLRGRLKKESFAKVNKDGSLEMPYEKIYGLEHLAIKILKKIKPNKKVYEKEVVFLIHGFQVLVVLLAFLTII
ncbi:Phospho-N-acetylmuramoyl-pentapeptide-transferase [subsurface metagenome]